MSSCSKSLAERTSKISRGGGEEGEEEGVEGEQGEKGVEGEEGVEEGFKRRRGVEVEGWIG